MPDSPRLGGGGRGARRWRVAGDGGAVGGAEVLPFGVLVLVVGALLVANAWGVVDAKFAVTSAAREATRTLVEGDDAASAGESADAAARAAFAAHGRDPARLVLERADTGDGFGRCAVVGVRATTQVPAIVLPWIGGYGDGFVVTAVHRERVDPFREGLAGEASC